MGRLFPALTGPWVQAESRTASQPDFSAETDAQRPYQAPQGAGAPDSLSAASLARHPGLLWQISKCLGGTGWPVKVLSPSDLRGLPMFSLRTCSLSCLSFLKPKMKHETNVPNSDSGQLNTPSKADGRASLQPQER